MPKRPFAPEAVYVLLCKPLGIGDLVMLSPFVGNVANAGHGLPVFIVSEYPAFMLIDGVEWVHPESLTPEALRRALVVSPTLSWRHAAYLRHAGWHLGYFLSDRLMCSYRRESSRYDARSAHYYDRTRPLAENLRDMWPSFPQDVGYPPVLAASFPSAGLPSAYCCIAPYSNWRERQYPLGHWVSVVRAMQHRLPVVLVGGSGAEELEMAGVLESYGCLNLAGRTSLAQLASVITRSELFIGNDSGPSHIAFLTAVASVAVFGCVGGGQRIPLDPLIQERIRLLGDGEACPFFPCYDGFSKPVCRNAQGCRCLHGVDPESVVRAALSLIKEP